LAEIATGYKKQVIPTSDSTLLQEEGIVAEEIFLVCKVCKKPFAENEEKLLCEKCKHYSHVEHSAKYHMKVYDHICLIDEIGVSRQSYVVLHGIAGSYSSRQIMDVVKLRPDELGLTIADLKKAGLVRRKFFSTEITRRALEVLPVLEKIYCSEPGVRNLIDQLGGPSRSCAGFPPLMIE
jgi:hypothetical protein